LVVSNPSSSGIFISMNTRRNPSQNSHPFYIFSMASFPLLAVSHFYPMMFIMHSIAFRLNGSSSTIKTLAQLYSSIPVEPIEVYFLCVIYLRLLW
jgi:hypothetical protein